MSKVIVKPEGYLWSGSREDRHLPKAAGFLPSKKYNAWFTSDPWVAFQVDPEAGFLSRSIELSHALTVGSEIEREMQHLIPESITLKAFQYVPAWAAVLNQDYHSLNGDDPGVGKSYEALLTFKALWDDEFGGPGIPEVPKLLVLCPPKKVYDWIRDCELWEIKATCLSISKWSTLDESGRAGIALMHDAMLIDEVHYLKNPEALRTSNTLPWLEFMRHSVSLSGSFPPNYNHELWAYCDAAMPRVTQGRKYKNFAKHYCNVVDIPGRDWWPKGNRNEDELYFRLRTSGMVRRTFDQCHPEVPVPKIEMVESSGEGFTQICEEQMADVVAAGYKPDGVKKVPQGVLARTRKRMAELKVPNNVALVHLYLHAYPDHQVIVLGHHRDALKAICDELTESFTCALIVGGLASKKAFDIKEDFLAGKIQVVVGNFTSMGVALDFQTATYVLISEPDYTPDKHHQGIGRARRFGQTKQVLVHFSVVKGSYDCRVLETALNKGRGIQKTLDGNRS